MRTPFSISGPVSLDRAGRNSLSDTLKIKTALEQSGFYKPDDDTYTPGEDTQFWDGLAAFQDANGLKVDHIAKPAGPTVQALNAALAKSPPKPILATEVGPASPDRRIRNEALIRADANSGDPGDLAPMLAATLRSKDGAQAAPEVADYIKQTFEADPEKGKRLNSQMAQLLHPDDADKISKASGIARANQSRRKAPALQSEQEPTPEHPAKSGDEEREDILDSLHDRLKELGEKREFHERSLRDAEKGEKFRSFTDAAKEFNKDMEDLDTEVTPPRPRGGVTMPQEQGDPIGIARLLDRLFGGDGNFDDLAEVGKNVDRRKIRKIDKEIAEIKKKLKDFGADANKR